MCQAIGANDRKRPAYECILAHAGVEVGQSMETSALRSAVRQETPTLSALAFCVLQKMFNMDKQDGQDGTNPSAQSTILYILCIHVNSAFLFFGLRTAALCGPGPLRGRSLEPIPIY